jgi:hypothetical protein
MYRLFAEGKLRTAISPKETTKHLFHLLMVPAQGSEIFRNVHKVIICKNYLKAKKKKDLAPAD